MEREREREIKKKQIVCRIYILTDWGLVRLVEKELPGLVRKRISDVKGVISKCEEREREYI